MKVFPTPRGSLQDQVLTIRERVQNAFELAVIDEDVFEC